MIKIEAVVRESKITNVIEHLKEIGIDSFSYWEVEASSREKVNEQKYRGVAIETEAIKRVFLSIVLNDDSEETAVKAILESASTGEVGDGKIFILKVQEGYRIRTGEKGMQILKNITTKVRKSKPVNKMQSFYDKFK